MTREQLDAVIQAAIQGAAREAYALGRARAVAELRITGHQRALLVSIPETPTCK